MVGSIISLSLFSLVPIIGILFFEWEWREVLLLYWFENITVGVVALINIFNAPIGIKSNEAGVITDNPDGKGAGNVASRAFMAIFFCIHYGMFTLVHGVFVWLIVGGAISIGGSVEGNLQLGPLIGGWLVISAIQLVVTFLRPHQAHASVTKSFLAPYKRIVALHLSIILGIFIIGALGLPAAAALLLIALHVIIDLVSLLKPKRAPKVEGV